jgi:hypothetical protein
VGGKGGGGNLFLPEEQGSRVKMYLDDRANMNKAVSCGRNLKTTLI